MFNKKIKLEIKRLESTVAFLSNANNDYIKLFELQQSQINDLTNLVNKFLSSNERESDRKHSKAKEVCHCKCPTGREVDENNHQICTSCGKVTS